MNIKGNFRDSVSFTNDILTLIAHISAGIGALMAFLGVTSNIIGSASMPAINLSMLALPMRLLVYILIAAALGWGLGALVSKLSQSRNEAVTMAAYLVAAIWGFLMVGVADLIAAKANHSALPEHLLFVMLGSALALWLSAFQFRAHVNFGSLRILRIRCDALLVFTITCGIVLLLSLLERQS